MTIPGKNGHIIIAGESIENPIWDEKELLYAAELWKRGKTIKSIAVIFNRPEQEIFYGLWELKKRRRLQNFVEIGALKKE